ncbi:MAG: helix-turn-helix domain-containing protein [Gemmiger sp.]
MPQNIHSFTARQHMLKNDFEVYHYRNEHLGEVALHHHDFYEIYLFISGEVSYTVESRTYHLTPGDVLLISPLELHQPRVNPDNGPYERLVLWIGRNYLEQLSSTQTSLTRCFDSSRPEHSNLLRMAPGAEAEVRSLMEQLSALSNDTSYGSDLLAKSLLIQLLVKLNRQAVAAPARAQDCSTDRVVDAVLQYINVHYNEPLTLDDLSARFFISKYHLLRKFDAQVGATVHRYILQKRLLIAKQLLASGVQPTEVYRHCGFGDYTNFYRSFKAEYHITPRQFAREARETPSALPVE